MQRTIRYRLLVLLSVLLWTATGIAGETSRPNFVLVMADDQGWGDIGFNSDTPLRTPVMDHLAATALRFDRFYAAAPVCSPTRGSVLTGRHPNRFGCFSWGHTIRPQEVTIAEALKAAGYATGHFGKWHLGSTRQASPISPGGSGFDEWVSSPNFYENSPLLSHNGKVISTEGESSMVTVEKALDFIRGAAKREQPFLAVVWFGSPHLPHVAWPELKKHYAEQPEALANYWAEITGMDQALGHLRQELRNLGVADNTLLWYTSDNGATTPGSTGGLAGKKGNLFEGGIRVPCMIEWPARIKSHRAIDLPCSTVDIYSTLLELGGAEVKHQPPLDGMSLAELLAGQAVKSRKPLGFWVYPTAGRGMRSGEMLAKQRMDPPGFLPPEEAGEQFENLKQYPFDELPGPAAWIDGDYKLHRIPAARPSDDPTADSAKYQLFNLASDAQETNDLADSEPLRVQSMKAALRAWQQSVINSLNGNDYAK